ncbi:MAG: response regulator [Verrucomicrobiota bacterium]
MKILIAEDDLTSRTALAGVLKMHGYQVEETSSGTEAWLALQQPDAPRLVILDWMMPEMDGPELLRRARELQTDRPPYIIMLTAKSEKPHVIAGLDAGADDYLAKPFDPGELLARVEVGRRMVEMQLRRHQQRANAQRMRVESEQRLHEMQDALAGKTKELRQAQAELNAAPVRPPAAGPAEGTTAALNLRDSFASPLSALPLDVDPAFIQAMLNIVQEALGNVVRHAQATQVDLRLSLVGRELEMVIQDNGRGFPPTSLSGAKAPGLLGMCEQIGAFGGAVEFLNEPGKGAAVRVCCTLPSPPSAKIP